MSNLELEHKEEEISLPGTFSRVAEDSDASRGWVRFGFVIGRGALKLSDVYDRSWPISIIHKGKRINGQLERDEIKIYILTSERREDGKGIKNVYRISYKRPESPEQKPQPILRNANAFAILNQPESEFDLDLQWMEDAELRLEQPIPFSWLTNRGERTSGPIKEIVITSGKAHGKTEFKELLKDQTLPKTDVFREYMRRRRKGEAARTQA